jgi:hypothetical protein
MMATAYYMPFNGSEPAPLEALQWKHLMREWYFNTHLMLNGSTTFIGQNQYIQVGDNIQIDASVLGPVDYNVQQQGKKAYLTAHVESVAHTFSVTPDGGRSFSTTVQFVRGVLTDENGVIFGVSGAGGGIGGALSAAFGALGGQDPLDAALDRNAKDLSTAQEKNRKVIGSSTLTDPDKNKLKGT